MITELLFFGSFQLQVCFLCWGRAFASTPKVCTCNRLFSLPQRGFSPSPSPAFSWYSCTPPNTFPLCRLVVILFYCTFSVCCPYPLRLWSQAIVPISSSVVSFFLSLSTPCLISACLFSLFGIKNLRFGNISAPAADLFLVFKNFHGRYPVSTFLFFSSYCMIHQLYVLYHVSSTS